MYCNIILLIFARYFNHMFKEEDSQDEMKTSHPHPSRIIVEMVVYLPIIYLDAPIGRVSTGNTNISNICYILSQYCFGYEIYSVTLCQCLI